LVGTEPGKKEEKTSKKQQGEKPKIERGGIWKKTLRLKSFE